MSNKKHGFSHTNIHRVWLSMRNRCRNPKDKDYRHYGGRGIKVCERWDDFTMFLKDMGLPEEGRQLDRIDNSKDYTPDNCRWVTSKYNNRNKRTNRLITLNGITLCISAWGEKLGVPRQTLHWRLKQKWPINKVLSEVRQ